mmetsp:Transcript_63397/g.75015  ORF Transcript_63397/g.75015 Transcript_63397/m.75015 type:complete len:211 (+) Transcript_63397:128-760(+)|eukprot:CAMPEP_0172497376 /NCGR_PEP_ID=MMETSP1066-20121228/99042_1 /TAXON_ID=671091 /ORGANISM="Coscinodiscus wailesii, Strain CCMP2513" /LENGTH=210 /DNA_ID=CAMNT_0013270109 /DNA_START=128 /DNA_END=760 /DNA_ORIENTATION=+
MKLATVTFSLFLSSAAAFVPAVTRQQSASPLFMAESANTESTRLQFLQSISTATLAATFLPKSASAAKYGGFGAGSPEVLDPKEAIVDTDILASDAVQKSLGEVKTYLATVKSMKETLASNSQADIGPTIRKNFDFSKLRTDLNTLNSAFDEETQRGTDRLIRAILQDVTELELANKQKAGVERSSRRVDTMVAKLNKLEKAFTEYLAFV